MSRLRALFNRYGWRAPVVVLALGAARLDKLRQAVFLFWLRLCTAGRKGRALTLERGITVSPGAHLELGHRLHIGARCCFEISVNPAARVSIGDDTWISHDCHLASYNQIRIGAQALIGEFVSLRDSSHIHADPSVPIKTQGDRIGSITIEDDVWIGRGSLILGRPEGVVIGRGAVIAANSVVSRSVPPLQVWGGTPARFIKER